MNNSKILYLCDMKPGACRGWEKGWTQCMNEMCEHTTNASHARIKTGHHFILKTRQGADPYYLEVEYD